MTKITGMHIIELLIVYFSKRRYVMAVKVKIEKLSEKAIIPTKAHNTRYWI